MDTNLNEKYRRIRVCYSNPKYRPPFPFMKLLVPTITAASLLVCLSISGCRIPAANGALAGAGAEARSPVRSSADAMPPCSAPASALPPAP